MTGAFSEIKASARTALWGSYIVCVPALLLAQLITFAASSLFLPEERGFLSSLTFLISSVILFLLTGVLRAGFCSLYLHVIRGENASLTDIFFCFTNHPDLALALVSLLVLMNLLLSAPFLLVLAVTGNLSILWMATFVISLEHPLLLLVVGILWAALLIPVNLRFAPAFFLYTEDPLKGTIAILQESNEMMAGHRMELFRLLLSFAGYLLLSVLSFGLGLLWVIPYMGVSFAEFYERIRGAGESGREPEEESAEPDTDKAFRAGD